MKKTTTFLILMLLVFQIQQVSAQEEENNKTTHVGFEAQWYPAGYQLMLTSEFGITSKDAIHLKAGYNIARRQDFSPYNDLENGGGFGFTVGYRRYFSENLQGFYVGARTDMWWLTIDWEDGLTTPSPTMGTTKITVFQPTAEVGYLYNFEDSPFSVGANLAAGYEINIVTRGAEVGQGAIGLLGLRVRYELR